MYSAARRLYIPTSRTQFRRASLYSADVSMCSLARGHRFAAGGSWSDLVGTHKISSRTHKQTAANRSAETTKDGGASRRRFRAAQMYKPIAA